MAEYLMASRLVPRDYIIANLRWTDYEWVDGPLKHVGQKPYKVRRRRGICDVTCKCGDFTATVEQRAWQYGSFECEECGEWTNIGFGYSRQEDPQPHAYDAGHVE